MYYSSTIIALLAISTVALFYWQQTSRNNELLPEMPAICKGKNMCFTKPVNYPEQIIYDLVNGVDDLFVIYQYPDIEHWEALQNKCSALTYYDLFTVSPLMSGIKQRQDEQRECDILIYQRPIYLINDTNGEVRFVVQANGFKQIIQTEQCEKPVPSPEKVLSSILRDYNLSCVECTLDYDFLVLSLDGSRLETAKMSGGVPVCCSCRKEAKL